MKNSIYLLFAGLVFFACQPKTDSEESTPEVVESEAVVDTDESLAYYGESITLENVSELSSLIGEVNEGDSIPVKIKGTINSTCAMKGCWMNLDGPEGDIRVTFKDYGFFVPKEGMEGNEAYIDGIAVKSTTDVETLKHYAEDAGKSEEEIAAITEPQEGIAIIANGVAIRTVVSE